MKNISKILSRNKIALLCSFLLLTFNISFANIDSPITKQKVDSLKRHEAELWYADGPIKKEEVKTEKKDVKKDTGENTISPSVAKIFNVIGTIFQILVWVILGAAILGAIYVVVINLKDFKFKTNTSVSLKSITIIEELEGNDLHEVDFSTYIDKCIKEQNYRLAIRYYYLWVMQVLNEANLIAFNIDKTNQDYAKELRKKSIFSKERLSHFLQCTNYYEYLWFGNFNISATTFTRIENTFKDFINKKA